MPYFFLFENLPAERPVGPLQGFYEPAKAAVRISDDPDASDGARGIGRRLRRFLASTFSARSDNSDQSVIVHIGQILREAGFLEIVCHYDGGNDEGFAFFDSAATADGSFTLKEMIDRLCGTQLGDPDYDPCGTLPKLNPDQHRDSLTRQSQKTEARRIEEWIDWFVRDVAVALLGQGFGTGEYAMTGRFRLDLRTGAITDLPLESPPDFRDSGAFSLDDYYPDEE
jgi:hypothetical protein